MKKYILGISSFFHDSAACVISDGIIIAAAQEERFTRIKHDSSFPILSINFCLEQAGISEAEIDVIVYYEKTDLVLDRIANDMASRRSKVALLQFNKIIKSWNAGKLNPELSIKNSLPGFNGEIKCIEHHHSHAAAAFFPSPFDEAAILTIDGVGEWASATISYGSNNTIKLLKQMNYPNSIGLFYSTATYYLGFKVNSGEYKMMGLAPYGSPIYIDKIKDKIITIFKDGSISLNLDFFDFSGVNPMSTEKWDLLFDIPRRRSESKIEKFHLDLAASIQAITEEVMLKMAEEAKRLSGSNNLCLSGGVALNCVGNGKILKHSLFKDIWIQPASGDAGNALGSAYAIWHALNDKKEVIKNGKDLMQNARLGPAYTSEEVIDFLEIYNLPYVKLSTEKTVFTISNMIEDGMIIGLFDGRMEFGPRALGGRSIIGDSRNPEMQEKMNLKIKFRESFRPFAPVVREENVSEWFDLNYPSRYMLLVAKVHPSKYIKNEEYLDKNDSISKQLKKVRTEINAVTHVDYSARVQTVPKSPDTMLRKILDKFYDNTGVPVLINTSFNLRGEPIVSSPMDAYRCMMRSHIDAILVEGVIIKRNDQPIWKEEGDWRDDFGLD